MNRNKMNELLADARKIVAICENRKFTFRKPDAKLLLIPGSPNYCLRLSGKGYYIETNINPIDIVLKFHDGSLVELIYRQYTVYILLKEKNDEEK